MKKRMNIFNKNLLKIVCKYREDFIKVFDNPLIEINLKCAVIRYVE